MWFLLGTTLTASFFDSLNPSAIAQQMLLQAMVKKKRHIWFFICGIGTANLIMGLAIYYGIATWVSKFLTKIVNAYPLYILRSFQAVHVVQHLVLDFLLGVVIENVRTTKDVQIACSLNKGIFGRFFTTIVFFFQLYHRLNKPSSH